MPSSPDIYAKSLPSTTKKEISPFYCEACNRSLQTAEALQEHISEHEVCGREGCTFSAHPKIVALHVQFHHKTGLYKKISNIQSPEEIAKWIAERKSRYPTNANIEARLAREKEMVERGERIVECTDKNNQERIKKGGITDKKAKKMSWKEKRSQWHLEKSDVKHKRSPFDEFSSSEDEEDPENLWNQNLQPFKGLSSLPPDEEMKNNHSEEDNRVAVEEISFRSILTPISFNSDVITKEPSLEGSQNAFFTQSNCEIEVINAVDTIEVINAIDTIEEDNSNCEAHIISSKVMADKDNDEEKTLTCEKFTCDSPFQDLEKVSLKESDNLIESSCSFNEITPSSENEAECNNNDSEPEECAIVKTTELCNSDNHVEIIDSSEQMLETTIDPRDTSESEKNLEENTQLNTDNSLKNSRSRKRRHKNSNNDKNSQQKNFTAKRKLTLLEKLLSQEIRHERNVILQCIHHVVSNGFFDDLKLSSLWNDDSDSDCFSEP